MLQCTFCLIWWSKHISRHPEDQCHYTNVEVWRHRQEASATRPLQPELEQKAVPIPKGGDWIKFLKDPANKQELITFISQRASQHLMLCEDNKQMISTHGRSALSYISLTKVKRLVFQIVIMKKPIPGYFATKNTHKLMVTPLPSSGPLTPTLLSLLYSTILTLIWHNYG